MPQKWTQKRRSRIGLIKSKFRPQRDWAGKRGIGWCFTFEEWVNWWESNLGHNWLNKRGTRFGQYVMGRKGDIGPYHPDNVLCITNSLNSKMAGLGKVQSVEQRLKNSLANRGTKNPNAKLSISQVLSISREGGTISSLARKYKVSRPTIKGIKTGKNWSHFTGIKSCG